MWRIGATAVPVDRSALAHEKLLEDILGDDIGLLGLPNQLLVVGRQVTDYGGRIDLLCVDQDGNLSVVEIKKDRTPREVVAQAMDYGYWVCDLGYDDIRGIFARYREGADFDEAFRATFQLEPPETINGEHQLVIVASALDPASERIVTYAGTFGLPINVVFFQTFEENGVQYLTRTWLIDPVEEAPARVAAPSKKQQTPWNGRDWYVSFGEGETRNWEDARTMGYVSAGGGSWYSGTLRSCPLEGGCSSTCQGEAMSESELSRARRYELGTSWSVPMASTFRLLRQQRVRLGSRPLPSSMTMRRSGPCPSSG